MTRHRLDGAGLLRSGTGLALVGAMLFCFAGSASATNRPWPFNGVVTNGWDRPVYAWSDTRGTFLVNPGETTGNDQDVDFVLVDGRWYKIGAHHTTIDGNGHVSDYSCVTGDVRGPCA